MFINQLRMKLGVTFGSPETTTGGHALKYYASVCLDIRRIGPVKIGDEVCGNRTRVKVVKSKLAPPFQINEFDIRYGTGIDALGDLLDKAVERDVIKKSGSYYSYDGASLGQGRERAREALLNDADMRERVRKGVSLAAPTLTRDKPTEINSESSAPELSADAAAA